MTAKLKVDWNAIRRQFEAGIPIPQLASAYRIRAGTIRVRVHREGWQIQPMPERNIDATAMPSPDKANRYQPGGIACRLSEGRIVLAALPPERRDAVMRDILTRYSEGETLDRLASDHRVSRATVYNWLLGGSVDVSHAELVTLALTARVERADRALEEARDALDVSRARERARFSRMDLERRRPNLYGPRTTTALDIGDGLADALARVRDRVRTIEHGLLADPDEKTT